MQKRVQRTPLFLTERDHREIMSGSDIVYDSFTVSSAVRGLSTGSDDDHFPLSYGPASLIEIHRIHACGELAAVS